MIHTPRCFLRPVSDRYDVIGTDRRGCFVDLLICSPTYNPPTPMPVIVDRCGSTGAKPGAQERVPSVSRYRSQFAIPLPIPPLPDTAELRRQPIGIRHLD